MSRPAIALVAGIGGFLLYVGAVVALADWVRQTHWTIELVYFLVAGTIWAWPAKALMFWAARERG